MRKFTVLRTADIKWPTRKADGAGKEPQQEFHEKKLARLWDQKSSSKSHLAMWLGTSSPLGLSISTTLGETAP